ncbi:MAG: endolytic transglycosylase MltG [Bdellovibrio sp.]|nr:MAG: endolytic transglycosylase MltG [Bdellovibrio sp.]
MKVLSIFIICIVAAAAAAWLMWQQFLNTSPSGSAEGFIYEVKPGKNLHQVARELENLGVVKGATWFLVMAKISGQSNGLKVGEYQLSRNLRPMEVLQIITSGKSVGRNFTIAEGLNLFEISAAFEEHGFGTRTEFWKTVHDRAFIKELLGENIFSLEGYLYPETYQITRYSDLRSIVRGMVERFLAVYRRSAEPLATKVKMSRHQVVTLASIIEKETGAPEERPVISSVFHNRLAKGMMLQTDPTVLYGKAVVEGHLSMNITRADLNRPTEYNTYTRTGLPPGPIASPGEAALVAAVQPVPSDYLYFVSRNNGTHIFSKDLASHTKAVNSFQVNAEARKGKSWRDLKKARAGVNLQKVAPNPPSSEKWVK